MRHRLTTNSAKSATRIGPLELKTFAYVCAVISLIAACFVLMYQAALLISRGGTSINPKTYFETHLISLILGAILWIIIARAAGHLKAYARTVIGSDDGRALDYVANALLLCMLYAILFGMASTVKTLFAHTPYLKLATTLSNLLPLTVILASSILLFMGTQKLNQVLATKFRNAYNSLQILSLIVFLVFIAAYALYFYHEAPRLTDDDGLPHFALSARVLLITYVLPYVIVWTMGLLACLNLALYAKNVEGVIYKLLFRDLYKGLMMSFIGTFLIQLFYVSNISSNRFSFGLLVAVGLLLLLIKGCLLVYRGTNQLYQLEK